MIEFQAVPVHEAGSSVSRRFMGSGRIRYLEERLVGSILYDWQYPFVRGEVAVAYEARLLWDPTRSWGTKGGLPDYHLTESDREPEEDPLDIFLEIKRKLDQADFNRRLEHCLCTRSPLALQGYRQARLALLYGHGFAYVTAGQAPFSVDHLREEVRAAIDRAIELRDRARRAFPDWRRYRQFEIQQYSHVLLPRPSQPAQQLVAMSA